MGRNPLAFSDDWAAWSYLSKKGYEMTNGVIKFRPEKLGNMPKDEQEAIDYLVFEWDWAYE